MDHPLIVIFVTFAALIFLAVSALRAGADSRPVRDDRPHW